MSESVPRTGWAVPASLAMALFLTILPMPAQLETWRPQWLALVLVFWALQCPDRVGVFWAFGTGLVTDAATGTLLGHHSLSFSVIAYLAVELHQRVRIFPLWQQGVFVWLLLLVERLLFLWVLGATGQPMPTLAYWAPTLPGPLLWPWISIGLRDWARRTGVL